MQVATTQDSGAGPLTRLESYLRVASESLAPEQREALEQIPDVARRLLALRGYLRAGRDISSRWAWTTEQIQTYEASIEYQIVLAELEKVRAKFAELNPGYRLLTDTTVRTLDQQIKKWNEAESVARVAEEFVFQVRLELDLPDYAVAPSCADLARFEAVLKRLTPRERPTVSVPGLSPHGQSRAFDFYVMRGTQIVAGTWSAAAEAAWDETGWTARLREAVTRASSKFEGPLSSPYEPWHYVYHR